MQSKKDLIQDYNPSHTKLLSTINKQRSNKSLDPMIPVLVVTFDSVILV